jgi:hypothetical protein
MDQAAKTQLVALATVQVRARVEAMMNLDSAQQQGREFMASYAAGIGLSAGEGRKAHDREFPAFKQSMLKWAAETAEAEVAKAVEEAEVEQERHTALLADLRQNHEDLLRKLADLSNLSDDVDAELMQLIVASRESWRQRAEQSHKDFMALVQEKHCLNLWHCFAKHLIPEGSVLVQLVELYEVK